MSGIFKGCLRVPVERSRLPKIFNSLTIHGTAPTISASLNWQQSLNCIFQWSDVKGNPMGLSRFPFIFYMPKIPREHLSDPTTAINKSQVQMPQIIGTGLTFSLFSHKKHQVMCSQGKSNRDLHKCAPKHSNENDL